MWQSGLLLSFAKAATCKKGPEVQILSHPLLINGVFMDDLSKVSTYDLLKEISNRARWRSVEDAVTRYRKIFYVGENSASFYYGMIGSDASLSVRKDYRKDLYYAHLLFESIDDCAVGLVGPLESQDRAIRRASRLKDLFDGEMFVPTEKQLIEYSARSGTTIENW